MIEENVGGVVANPASLQSRVEWSGFFWDIYDVEVEVKNPVWDNLSFSQWLFILFLFFFQRYGTRRFTFSSRGGNCFSFLDPRGVG